MATLRLSAWQAAALHEMYWDDTMVERYGLYDSEEYEREKNAEIDPNSRYGRKLRLIPNYPLHTHYETMEDAIEGLKEGLDWLLDFISFARDFGDREYMPPFDVRENRENRRLLEGCRIDYNPEYGYIYWTYPARETIQKNKQRKIPEHLVYPIAHHFDDAATGIVMLDGNEPWKIQDYFPRLSEGFAYDLGFQTGRRLEDISRVLFAAALGESQEEQS